MKYGKITDIRRINGSINGNPNYLIQVWESDNAHEALTMQGAELIDRRTKSDISDSYGIIPNQCKVGKTMAYTLTKAGRIERVHKVV